MTREQKIKQLADAFSIARDAAARLQDHEDGGTCNFDTATIRLFRWRDDDVQQAAKIANVRAYKWEDHYYNYHVFPAGIGMGQANRRSAMAEAFSASMKESGYDTNVWYQID